MFVFAGSFRGGIVKATPPQNCPSCSYYRSRNMQEAKQHMENSFNAIGMMLTASSMAQNSSHMHDTLQSIKGLMKKNLDACKFESLTIVESLDKECGTQIQNMPYYSPSKVEYTSMRPSYEQISEARPDLPLGYSSSQRQLEDAVNEAEDLPQELGKRQQIRTRGSTKALIEKQKLAASPTQQRPVLPKWFNRTRVDQEYQTPSPHRRRGYGRQVVEQIEEAYVESGSSRIYDDDGSSEQSELGEDDGLRTPSSEDERVRAAQTSRDPHLRKIAQTTLKTKSLLRVLQQGTAERPRLQPSRGRSRGARSFKPTGSSARTIPKTQPGRFQSTGQKKRYPSKYVARVRGEYRSYSESEKNEAILYAEEHGFHASAVKFGIPVKNIKRWKQNGAIRKKGGRKTQDPAMERQLATWIYEQMKDGDRLPPTKQIKKRALQLSKIEGFKASKGWLEKFMLRNKLMDRTTRRKQVPGTFLDVESFGSFLRTRPEPQDSQISPSSLTLPKQMPKP